MYIHLKQKMFHLCQQCHLRCYLSLHSFLVLACLLAGAVPTPTRFSYFFSAVFILIFTSFLNMYEGGKEKKVLVAVVVFFTFHTSIIFMTYYLSNSYIEEYVLWMDRENLWHFILFILPFSVAWEIGTWPTRNGCSWRKWVSSLYLVKEAFLSFLYVSFFFS